MAALLKAFIACSAWALGSIAYSTNINDFADFSLRSTAGALQLPGRLYIPPEAAANPAVPRPFILFMHGAGESGTNNSLQVNANIDNLLAEAKRRGAYLYAPQTSGGWASPTINARVMTMVDRALDQQSVDPRRMYVTGLSMGGGGTWNILHEYGERFAAGVPICAVSPVSGYSASRFLDDAIWAFHARNDGTVSVGTSRAVVNNILTAGGEATPSYLSPRDPTDFQFASSELDLHYTEYYTGGHGIWGRVYNTPALYDWMFSHSLVPEPSGVMLAVAAMGGIVCARRRSPGV